MFLSMFSSKNINFFLLFIFLLHLPIQPLDLYVSNFSQTPGYGSEASPFISITSVLNATYSDSILNVYLLSNQKPYIIDIAINIQKDLKIVYQNGGNHAIIDFVGIGSIEVTGEYSVIFEGVSIRRSIVDSANFAINLIGLSLLNLTV